MCTGPSYHPPPYPKNLCKCEEICAGVTLTTHRRTPRIYANVTKYVKGGTLATHRRTPRICSNMMKYAQGSLLLPTTIPQESVTVYGTARVMPVPMPGHAGPMPGHAGPMAGHARPVWGHAAPMPGHAGPMPGYAGLCRAMPDLCRAGRKQ